MLEDVDLEKWLLEFEKEEELTDPHYSMYCIPEYEEELC